MKVAGGDQRAGGLPKSHRRFTFPFSLFPNKSHKCVKAEKRGRKSSQWGGPPGRAQYTGVIVKGSGRQMMSSVV